jgi:predicted sulfurtransferase
LSGPGGCGFWRRRGSQAGQNPYLTREQAEAIAKMPAAGEEKRVKAEDIDRLLADGRVVFLDVREPKEIEELGTLEGYVNIPLSQLEQRMHELPKDKAILTA